MFKVKQINFVEDRKIKPEQCESINLIIGGNNSGKTTMLNDIYSELRALYAQPPNNRWTCGMKLVVENAQKEIEKVFPGIFELSDFCNFNDISRNLFIRKIKNSDNIIPWNHDVLELLQRAKEEKFEYEFDIDFTKKQDQKIDSLFHFFVKFMIGYEECIDRLNISFNTTVLDINESIENDFVLYLYKNKKIFDLVKRNIKDVYGINIDFDNVPQGFKPIRIVKKNINKNLSNHFALNREWSEKSVLLDSVGHGIRSYLKLVFSLINPTNQIILIDEPETFIHPPQRRALGRFVAKIAQRENKQLFIATHDAEFIRGVLSASLNIVKVIRLSNDVSGFHLNSINTVEIKNLLDHRASNLLNERIINSLFYEKTIICENENDRIIYEEAAAEYHWNKFHNSNFIGFNGHHETIKFYNKLKKLNIYPSAILDIDYLRTGAFPETIIDPELKSSFSALQNSLKLLLPKNSSDYSDFKSIGLKIFNRNKFKSESQNIKTVINGLKNHKIYIVPVGELESWLRTDNLNVSLAKIRNKKDKKLSDFLYSVLID